MAEYIDREAALKRFEEIKQSGISLKDAIYIDGVMAVIETLPAADVEPVRHGEWVDTPNGTETICSYCKADWNVFDNDTYRFNYCPHCGAKMEREDEEDGTAI